MSDQTANAYVTRRLADAGITSDLIAVDTQDSNATTGERAFSVRTRVRFVDGRPMGVGLARRILRILADLPTVVDCWSNADGVTVFWMHP